MARKAALVVTGLIAIADLVLIGVAVHDSGARPAAGIAVSQRSTSPFPAPAAQPRDGSDSSAGTGDGDAPSTISQAAGGAVLPDIGLGAAPAAEPIPTIDVLGASRTEDDPAAQDGLGPDVHVAAPPRDQSDSASGRVLLAVGSDGGVIRAVRGTCTASATATIAISRDFGATWTRAATTARQVLAVEVSDGGVFSTVSADAGCRPRATKSLDGGATWTTESPAGAWYPSPDSEAIQVVAPSTISTVGCVPRSLAASSGAAAVVACADDTVRATRDGGDTWQLVSTLPGVVSLSFAGPAVGYALAATDACAAAVYRTGDGAASWQQIACLGGAGQPGPGSRAAGDSAPRAIATAGGHILVESAGGFVVSADSGVTWSPVG